MIIKNEKIHNYLDIRKPKIIERKTKKALVYSIKGEYGKLDYSLCWSKLWSFIKINKLFAMKMEFLGLCLDNPKITPVEECRYEACITINKEAIGDDEIMIKEIPGGKYLKFSYNGSYEFLNEVYDFIFDTYLKQENHIIRSSPIIEKYLNNPEKIEPENLRSEIFIPIN